MVYVVVHVFQIHKIHKPNIDMKNTNEINIMTNQFEIEDEMKYTVEHDYLLYLQFKVKACLSPLHLIHFKFAI